MKSNFILIFYFILFFTKQAFSQEIIGNSDNINYSLNCDLYDKYFLVKTDQNGNITWKISFLGSNPNFDDKSEFYLIAGFSNEKNGKILSNPSDYDYWLVPIKSKYEFSIFPNPNLGLFTLYSEFFNNSTQFTIFDSSNRVILNSKITEKNTLINLKNISQGSYFLKIFDENEILKFEKICIN